MLNRNGGLIACLSAYATLSNAFQLPALEPQMKIHSTYFWGKMLRSDALRNKIYLMSFNLTVVLSQLLNRGRHMWWCGCVQGVCRRCRCVYESSQSYCDLALKKICEVKKQYESIHNIPATLFNSAWKTITTWPLSPHHHLCEDTTGFRFLDK